MTEGEKKGPTVNMNREAQFLNGSNGSRASKESHHYATTASVAPAPSSLATSSSFKLPPNPAMPQDLSLIMEMVSSNQVVGSLPPLAMSAAAKRKLVEESIARAKAKGKAREMPPPVSAPIEDSDSSSEGESSSEEDSEMEVLPSGAGRSHEEMKAELDSLLGASVSKGEVEMDSGSEESSSEEEDEAEEISSFPIKGHRGPRQSILDDLDEDGPVPSDPILSLHEDPLPPVAQPPISKLPEGEAVRLAGEVVSWMKDKKVEVWVAKEQAREEAEEALEAEQMMTEEDPPSGVIDSGSRAAQVGEPGEIVDLVPSVESTHVGTPGATDSMSTESQQPTVPKAESSQAPHFASAGTIVVRAMQSQPGSPEDGWLEEGSVVCWQDGRVVGTISETFGPLTSPFYSIRLPPPPCPYPGPQALITGTRLFYPASPAYRSFVNMHAVRDPRFKGSDASNFYDEEVGEDEMEWSDDEAEAEAKRRRKASRGSRAPSVDIALGRRGSNASTVGIGGGHSSLPQRPHFDYQPDESGDTASLYGDEGSVYGSEDGSVISQGSRRALPGPYDDLVNSDIQAQGRSRGRGRGGRGGPDRGRTRGRGRGGGGSARGRQQDRHHGGHSNGPHRAVHQEHWHPPSPGPAPHPLGSHGPQQSFYPGFTNQPMSFSSAVPYQAPFAQMPSQPYSFGFSSQPGYAQPQGQWTNGGPQNSPSGTSPAINPKFAGQFAPQSHGGPWRDSE